MAGSFAGIPSQLARGNSSWSREPLAPSAWNPAPLCSSGPGLEGQPATRGRAVRQARGPGGAGSSHSNRGSGSFRPRVLHSPSASAPGEPLASPSPESLGCLSPGTRGTSLPREDAPSTAAPSSFPSVMRASPWPLLSDCSLSKARGLSWRDSHLHKPVDHRRGLPPQGPGVLRDEASNASLGQYPSARSPDAPGWSAHTDHPGL